MQQLEKKWNVTAKKSSGNNGDDKNMHVEMMGKKKNMKMETMKEMEMVQTMKMEMVMRNPLRGKFANVILVE